MLCGVIHRLQFQGLLGMGVGSGASFSFLLILGQYWRNTFPPNFQPKSDP
jgi:hypothetical protein